jgi:hypothetical protein
LLVAKKLGLRILPRLGAGPRAVGIHVLRFDTFRLQRFQIELVFAQGVPFASTISPKARTLTFGQKLPGTAGGPVL